MKKLIAILMVAVMCLSLAACGGSGKGAEKALIGQWQSLEDGDIIEFKENGELVWLEQSFEWDYEKADQKYSMTVMGMTVTFEIVEENGVRSLTPLGMLSPWTYYHIDDIEKAEEANK